MAAMNTPISTAVFAIDVLVGSEPITPAAKLGYDAMVATLQPRGYLIADSEGLSFTITLEDVALLEPSILQIAAAITNFENAIPSLHTRCVIHYGVVFRSESEGKISYVGSAIRGALSALKRAPNDIFLVGTPDLFNHVASLRQPMMKVNVQRGGVEGTDFCLINLRDKPRAPAASTNAAPTSNSGTSTGEVSPSLLQFLKQRLATEVGPFAGPLVDKAKRNTSNASGLIAALALEVDNPTARVKFEVDVNAFLRANKGG